MPPPASSTDDMPLLHYRCRWSRRIIVEQLKAIRASIEANGRLISANGQRIEANGQRIEANGGRLDSMEGHLEVVAGEISKIHLQLEWVRARVGVASTQASTADVGRSRLEEMLQEPRQQLAELQGRVDQLEDK